MFRPGDDYRIGKIPSSGYGNKALRIEMKKGATQMKKVILCIVLLIAVAIAVLSHTLDGSRGSGVPQNTPAALQVSADQVRIEGSGRERVAVYERRAEARMGEYQLHADRITVDERNNTALAEGHASFRRGDERISGSSIEWNYGGARNQVKIIF
jgi:lipopolysaccharide assembly outer membrane protein LptD (OstA)